MKQCERKGSPPGTTVLLLGVGTGIPVTIVRYLPGKRALIRAPSGITYDIAVCRLKAKK